MKNILILLLLTSTFIFSQTTTGDFIVKNLNSNSKNSDFGTTFYGKDKIIFSSSRQEGSGLLKAKWKKNKQPFLDLYEGVIGQDGTVTDIKPFSGNLNSKFHESSISFTPDQKTVYFTRDNYLNNKLGKDDKGWVNLAIYKASVAPDGSWTDIQPMPFNNVKYSVGHPSISKDGKKLYFISDMPGTIGSTDIFVVDILSNGTYGIPKNLGNKINTTKREMFPYIDEDNVLYFSSDGRADGLGGLDVYAAQIYPKAISDVLHLGDPVNSKFDDFGYILKNNIHEGYFSSNRTKGSKGDDDIYHFKNKPPLKIECNQKVNGLVKDKKTGELVAGAVVVLFDENDNEMDSQTTKAGGAFDFTVDCEKTYKIVAAKEKYTKDEDTFTTKNNPDAKITLGLEIDPIPEPIKVVEIPKRRVVINIDPIYFDFNKANIRPDAKVELDKVIAVMQQYPDLLVEGGSHTDARGNDNYNDNLSARRAKATVAYIVKHGIDANRISAKGYGETQLVNHCSNGVKCDEIYHQQNRRTEFVILNPDVLGYITE